jgi:hypothetical protein
MMGRLGEVGYEALAALTLLAFAFSLGHLVIVKRNLTKPMPWYVILLPWLFLDKDALTPVGMKHLGKCIKWVTLTYAFGLLFFIPWN